MRTTSARIPGIPTRYRGRDYRSRLEAKWAAFFDGLGWRYEYEPCDFEGWIPDFVLCEARTVFVEVKPVLTFPAEVAARIQQTSCEEEVLIVGMTFPRDPLWAGTHPCVGWLRETARAGDDESGDWAVAPFGVWTPPAHAQGPRIGFCHVYQSFRDRITGTHDGGHWGALPFDETLVARLWAQAGNQTQWHRR